MTPYQWKVVLALCRVTLAITERTTTADHEWYHMMAADDMSTLRDALDRQEALDKENNEANHG